MSASTSSPHYRGALEIFSIAEHVTKCFRNASIEGAKPTRRVKSGQRRVTTACPFWAMKRHYV